MRIRADQQLFLSYVLLISALTLALSVGADLLLRTQLLGTIEQELRRELELGRVVYDTSPDLSPDSVARLVGTLSGRRVTIVDPQGEAIGESGEPPLDIPIGDDYRTRPEILEALEDGEGRAVRRSEALNDEHLYLATRTGRGDVMRVGMPLSEISAALGSVQRGILWVAVGAVMLAALLSFGFSLAVTRPLRRIGDAARALAAGDLSRRVRIEREDELGDLGLALNTLADELQRRLAQLEGERAEMQALIDSMSEGVLAVAPNGTLRRSNPAARRMFALGPRAGRVTPEMISRRPDFLRLVGLALEGQGVPARELAAGGMSLLATAHPLPDGGAVLVFLDISELRRLEGVRRDFVANASHELKTPLTAIRGYSETLLDPELPPELVHRFAEIVKANADRLQRIVDDLLDLSRLEGGGWRVEPELVPLETAAREIWRTQTFAEKRIELKVELAAGHEEVWADPQAVAQILSNLFSNAVRYSPPGGVITLRTLDGAAGQLVPRAGDGAYSPMSRWTVVEVEDEGTGIPAVHLSRIFERFYRADPARGREGGGTGLGLSIVKHLVESHGGWTEAESKVGVGTTIRFILPAPPPAAVSTQ